MQFMPKDIAICQTAMVITNGYFTPPQGGSRHQMMSPWDRKELTTAMNSIDFPATSSIARPAPEPVTVTEINPPHPAENGTTCATCGKPESKRSKPIASAMKSGLAGRSTAMNISGV